MPTFPRLAIYVGIGAVAGVLSGLFGIGGGVLIIPALVMLLQFPQKVASGTSLLAVAPISLGGMISYAVRGQIDWPVALALAIGAVLGGLIGSWLLVKLPSIVVTWIFLVVLVGVAIRMFFEDPARGVARDTTWLDLAIMVMFGVFVGVLAGLVGLGGGIIIVPALIVFWGFGDVIAKGISLVALVPNAITSSVLNLRRGNADLWAGLTIGVIGAGSTFLGGLLAEWVNPRIGSILFAVFLLLIAAQLATRTMRRIRAERTSGVSEDFVAEEAFEDDELGAPRAPERDQPSS